MHCFNNPVVNLRTCDEQPIHSKDIFEEWPKERAGPVETVMENPISREQLGKLVSSSHKPDGVR